MDYQTVMDLKFDAIEKAQDWWTTYNSLSGRTATSGTAQQRAYNGPVKFVSDGANSRIEIDIAARGAVIPDVAGAYAVKNRTTYGYEFADDQQMDGKADLYDVGALINCFDPDPAIRGRYVVEIVGGAKAFTRQSPDIVERTWPDNNHPERLLELLLCSWIATNPVHPGAGNQQGWVSPPDQDWSRARITYDMRGERMMLGKWGKIVQHVQGDIPRLTALLPAGSHATPNFIFVADLISDQLGFGNDGWGRPNKVEFVYDTGRRPVVLNYTPDDVDWRSLGSVTRGLSFYHYVVVPIAELLTSLVGNSYLMAVHDKPQPDDKVFNAVADGLPEKDRFAGKLSIYGIKIEVPVE